MLQSLLTVLIAGIVSVGSFFGINLYTGGESNFGASVQPAALQTYTLSGSGVTSSATSITLSSFTITQSGYEILDSDMSSTFYITIEPGNRTRQEVVSCTTVTQNSGSTATLSGCTRGLSPISPFTASTTLQFAHGGGAQVIFSDPPQLFNEYPAKSNVEAITGEWTYSINPHGTTATNTNQFVTLGQADDIESADAATSTEVRGGLVELGTLAEQADSFDGGVAKPTVLQTKNSTNTCQVIGTYNIVASSTTGKLNPPCFDQTYPYAFSGTTTFSGATTSFSGEVDIAASRANPLRLGGIYLNLVGSLPTATSTTRVSPTGQLTFSAPTATSTFIATSTTWVRPAHVTSIKYLICGGGGGGGGVAAVADSYSGGGGGGGCVQGTISVNANISLTIGDGGAGGGVNAAGENGVNSSFTSVGTTVTANGGNGGSAASGSQGSGGGGGSPVAPNGGIPIPGGTGRNGILIASEGIGGDGGDSVLGFGGKHAGISATGLTGVGFSAGGSGASANDGSGRAGGNGTDGFALFEWFE